MDIEAIVKKYMEEQDWYNFPEDSLRAALTELAAGYSRELGLAQMAADSEARYANELKARIVQLEAELVPDGWKIQKKEDDSIILTKHNESGLIVGCVVSEDAEIARHIPESTLWLLASDMLAAAPQPNEDTSHD